MEQAARRYIRWVLMIHLALLALVAAGVLLVARDMYDSSRQQAIDQARARHELIARQTSRAIEGHYSAILADLHLLGFARKDERLAAGLKETWLLAPALWNQMGQRVSHLLRVDPTTMQASATYPEGAAAQVKAGQILGDAANRDWVSKLKAPAVSSYRPDTGGGYTLVAVPVEADGSVLVAVVPFGNVQRSFLDVINAQDAIAVTILEDSPTLGSPASFPGALGFVDQISDPRVRAAAEHYLTTGGRGSEVARVPVRGYARDGGNPLGRDDGTPEGAPGTDQLKERLFVIEPLGLPGKRSLVLVSAWLTEVDRVVAATFRRAAIGAGVVMLLVTGILVSTALQLIRTRVRLERERHAMLRREIDQARQIQLAWLPSSGSGCPRACDIAAANKPATQISGDFYDWFELDRCRVAVTIGDVTGHGMSAAFLMATTQLLVRTTMRRARDPGSCLDEVNRLLCGAGFGGQFVTMLVAVLDTDRGEIEIASAGHYPPLLSNGDGSLHPLAMESSFVLGIEPEVSYETSRFSLSGGSSLLLYTDGVIEARSAAGEHFTASRLRKALDGGHASAQQMIDAVIAAVDDFRGARDLQDDLTIVALQLQPVGARAESPVEVG
jgi:serine phosphatase RsbU (regulator of sigma subunit)